MRFTYFSSGKFYDINIIINIKNKSIFLLYVDNKIIVDDNFKTI